RAWRIVAIQLHGSRILIADAQLILILWPCDLNPARQRSCRATAKRLLIRIRNIRDQLASLIITLQACKTNSTNAVEPKTPHELRVAGSGRQKLLEQIITPHHPRVLLRLTTRIRLLIEKLALRVNQ